MNFNEQYKKYLSVIGNRIEKYFESFDYTALQKNVFEAIMKSITEKLMVLPDETVVYPGHGKSTLIMDEKPIYLDLKPRIEY